MTEEKKKKYVELNFHWLTMKYQTKEKDELSSDLSFLFLLNSMQVNSMEINKKSKTNLLRRLTRKFTPHPSTTKDQSVQTSFNLLKKQTSEKSSDRFVS